MRDVIVFYHGTDLDGKCSGALARMAHPECELIGISRGDEFPFDDIVGKKVYMLDYSLLPDEMRRVNELAGEFIWIDHHKSAIIGIDSTIRGLRQIGDAGCELTWKYLKLNDMVDDSRQTWMVMPKVVKLLGRFDVWDHAFSPDVLPFQYGMKMQESEPERNMALWEMWFTNFPEYILRNGEIIQDYTAKQDAIYAEGCAFEVDFNGMPCVAMNKMFCNKLSFKTVDDGRKYDTMIAFGWSSRAGKWTVSMYSDKPSIDVSKIAAKYGGGGHKGAAGFLCDFLPFEVQKKK